MDDERPITVTSVRTVTNDGKPVTSADKLEPGMQFGRYLIKKLLGEGGMGVVYAAFDAKLNRSIAIKVLRVSGASGDIDTHSARARMIREAQAMAMCGHPNLVQVYDVGTYANDVFIAMEYVEGVTLRDWMANHDPKDWKTLLEKFVDAGKGLSAAHQRHLIHRDFKPENVMVDTEGHVRVMDFGLARHTGGDDTQPQGALNGPLTQTGMIMGTPAYMAPEQFLADTTDHRTDQFAFCIALFEALYGHRPFGGDTMKALAKSVMKGEIALPPRKHAVPDFVLTALLKGLQTEPEDRQDNMAVLIDALITKPHDSSNAHPWLFYLTAVLVAVTGILMYTQTADTQGTTGTVQRPRNPYVIPTPGKLEPVIPSVTRGVVTKEQMKATAVKYQEDIDDCIEHGRKRDAGLTGHVFLKFDIVATSNGKLGEVEKVRLVDHDLFDHRTARCIRGMATGWEFPAPSCPGAPVGIKCEASVSHDIDIPEAPEFKKPAKKRKRKGR